MDERYQKLIARQVREFVREGIDSGEYVAGEKFPSTAEVAEKYGIFEPIVAEVSEVLVKEGLLEACPDGSFIVKGRLIERDMEELEGFTQTMRDQNIAPSFKILSKDLRIAGNKYAKMFDIKPEDKIVAIKRVCYADGEPVSVEQTFIPYYLVPKLEGIDLSVFSIYEVYTMFGIRLAHATQTLDLVRPSAGDARILGIDQNAPTMLFQCITYDVEGRVIEFNRNYTRGDKCSFKVHFTR